MEQALYYINLYDEQTSAEGEGGKGVDPIDDAPEEKEKIQNYQNYVRWLNLIHRTEMLVTKSRDAPDGQKS